MAAGDLLTRGEMISGCKSLGKIDSEAVELLESIPGSDNDFILSGGSCIIGPDTNFIVEPLYNENMIITAELDRSSLIEHRSVMDSDGHYSRPDVFQLKINRERQVNIVEGEGE